MNNPLFSRMYRLPMIPPPTRCWKAFPSIFLWDGPANHLDLPSIQCLEKALDDCPCGLLLVSHDLYFLDRLTRTRWHIVKKTGTGEDFELKKK